MDTEKLLKRTQANLDSVSDPADIDYYKTIRKQFMQVLTEEKISLVCGMGPDGLMHIYERPMGQDNTRYASVLHVLSEILRRFSLKYCDKVSQYFYGREEHGCKSCYHRAEYIVHGMLCGMAISTLLFMVLEWLVLHK